MFTRRVELKLHLEIFMMYITFRRTDIEKILDARTIQCYLE